MVTDATLGLKTLERIRPEGMAEQVVKQIVALIETGSLKSGDRLPSERTLASKLGIGRPTLREALRGLSLLGILNIRHGGGIYVSSLKPDTLLGPLHMYIGLQDTTIAAIIDARKIIESGVITHVAKCISDAEIGDLYKTVDQMADMITSNEDANRKLERIHELAKAFRVSLRTATNNPILARALESLDVLSAAARSKIIAQGTSMYDLFKSHKSIVDALASRDVERSRQAVIAHLDLLSVLYNATSGTEEKTFDKP